jgi:hypothetical protein
MKIRKIKNPFSPHCSFSFDVYEIKARSSRNTQLTRRGGHTMVQRGVLVLRKRQQQQQKKTKKNGNVFCVEDDRDAKTVLLR